MSRGPGRWQRAILERLKTREQFYLAEILPDHTEQTRRTFGHAQMAALRAAHLLAAQGRIAVDTKRSWTNRIHWTGERWQPLGGTIVARPGVKVMRIGLEIAYEVKTRLEQREYPRPPLRGKSSTKVPTLKPFQVGAVASGVKLLTAQGKPVEADTIAAMTGGTLPHAVIEAGLEHLKALGQYQRIVDEARQSQSPGRGRDA
jgi:hypothetical protein